MAVMLILFLLRPNTSEERSRQALIEVAEARGKLEVLFDLFPRFLAGAEDFTYVSVM